LLVMLSGIVSSAAVSIGAAEYVSHFLPLSQSILLIGIVAIIALLAIWGIFESVFLAGLVTLIEISGLLLVIYVGVSSAEDMGMTTQMFTPPFEASVWAGILTGSLLAFFAFIGFEDMANVAEEVEKPHTTLPKAILATLVVSTVLYLCVVTVVLLNVPLDQLAGSAAPLTFLFVGKYEILAAPFGIVAILATFNGALIQVIMASRVLYGLSSRGHLPAELSRVNATTRTPVLATAIVAGAALVLALWLPIEELAASTSFIVLIVFFAVNLSLIRIKRRPTGPMEKDKIFIVPIWIPVTGAVFSFALALARLL
jgi:APA family basic amino acid/polyamine antiporter